MKNVPRYSCKVSIIYARFSANLNFLDRFSKNYQIPNFMKIRPMKGPSFSMQTNG